jgi:tRNA nucleotidyltransferase/poly(A) polymerase
MDAAEAARRLVSSAALRRLTQLWSPSQAFLTGGSLRDRLLGLPTHDLDVAVIGDAEAAARAAALTLGGHAFALGRPPRRTWRVVAGRHHLDIWGIPGSLEDDIWRRDFTVNALCWRLPRGPLFDLTGGLADLSAGRVRAVRAENLRDDPLRVLRGLRLVSTRPMLRLTRESESLLRAMAHGLTMVARERVTEELRLLLAGPGSERALLAAARLGVLAALQRAWRDYAHGEAAARLAGRLARLATARRDRLAAGAATVANAVLALPAAGFPARFDVDHAAAALARIGWPARTARHAAVAAGLGERLRTALRGDPRSARELALAGGDDLAAALAWATAAEGDAATLAAARRLLHWQHAFTARPALLSGDEIARLLDLAPGPERAEAVRELRTAQARGDVTTPAQARRLLRARHPR